MTAQKHIPERIRVAQDAEGFWTCREAVSGSQEYVRADVVDGLLGVLPDLSHVISWLENGCDPASAAKELRIYQGRIERAKAKAEGQP